MILREPEGKIVNLREGRVKKTDITKYLMSIHYRRTLCLRAAARLALKQKLEFNVLHGGFRASFTVLSEDNRVYLGDKFQAAILLPVLF